MTPREAKALALVAVSKIEAKSAAEEQSRDEARKTMLDDNEAENIVRSLIRQRGDRGITDLEAQTVLNEIITLRFMATCADLVCKGLIDVDYDPELPETDRLVFKRRDDISDDLRDALNRRIIGGT